VVGPWAAAPLSAQQLDINQIFPCANTPESPQALCDEARGIIMTTCQTCHMFLRVARARFDADKWAVVIANMGQRAGDKITKEQLEHVLKYLTVNLNPSLPPPVLPPGLAELQ
jgi:hypothetical protein